MTETIPAKREREIVLQTKDLKVHFEGENHEGKKVTIRAVDGVNFTMHKGEIVALVGESGCGKTTLARVFSLIYKATSGEVTVLGRPLKEVAKNEREYYRKVQLIFQDPFASMNTLKRISHIIGRVLEIHKMAKGRTAIRARIEELLGKVNLTPAEYFVDRFPTDLSGGQKQRVSIARALAVDPAVILADEPTSMLDASIRLEVLNLLGDLRDNTGLSVLVITHDIASARYLSDQIYVMYGGRVVEAGPTEAVVSDPVHPYAELLISAAPDPAKYKGSGHSAVQSSSTNAPVDNSVEMVGCRFANRCPYVQQRCIDAPIPEYVSIDGSRRALCVLAEDRPDFINPQRPGATGTTQPSEVVS
ncbi:ABC transporter ATP-binding protein [Tessaracoccus caeni]|uniref:ABC transporter ATP-binding protein n=1 Tax=Tessaracoccus caeni TaxID=3031239 RepID=UPI0023DA9592|nr:ABC transporter ATP-binding protein [Tessaracoccus caeni]MDF1488365.1 ABC transporter ATP-binding protein [Tessaracoccus caeni]